MTAAQSSMELDVDMNRSLAEAVRPHLNAIRSRSQEVERAREPLQETVDLVRRLGIVRALVPRAYGGLEHDLFDWLQSLRLLARADMSVSWFAGLASAHAFALTKFDRRLHAEVWGGEQGPDAVISSATALAEGGTATPVAGGWTLTGRWRFSSGITVADWVMVLMKAPNPETAELQTYWAFVPKADFTVRDTWQVTGMRGTGSHDVVVTDAFLPAHRLGGPGLAVEPAGGQQFDNALYSLPFLVIYPIIFAPVALGGAEASIELFTNQLKKRKAALSGTALVDSPLSQVRLAEAVMKTRAVSAIAENRWRDVAQHVRTAKRVEPEVQLQWRVDDAFIGREAMRIVEYIMEGAGASVYHVSEPLQRFWRDLHATGGHTQFNTDSAMQMLGRHLLGLAPDDGLV